MTFFFLSLLSTFIQIITMIWFFISNKTFLVIDRTRTPTLAKKLCHWYRGYPAAPLPCQGQGSLTSLLRWSQDKRRGLAPALWSRDTNTSCTRCSGLISVSGERGGGKRGIRTESVFLGPADTKNIHCDCVIVSTLDAIPFHLQGFAKAFKKTLNLSEVATNCRAKSKIHNKTTHITNKHVH